MVGNRLKPFGVLLLLLGLALQAIAYPANKLGVVLNNELALKPVGDGKSPRFMYAWTSIVEFDKNVVEMFKDDQIVNIIEQAWNDLNANYQKIPIKNYDKISKPDAISAIIHGKRLYISSSLKAPNIEVGGQMQTKRSFVYTSEAHPKVKAALLECQVETAGNTKHNYNAGCGEAMAAHIFFSNNPKGASLNGAKVVTWGRRPRDKANPFGIKNPCQDFTGGTAPNKWGCSRFIMELGLGFIPEGTPNTKTDGPAPHAILPVCLLDSSTT